MHVAHHCPLLVHWQHITTTYSTKVLQLCLQQQELACTGGWMQIRAPLQTSASKAARLRSWALLSCFIQSNTQCTHGRACYHNITLSDVAFYLVQQSAWRCNFSQKGDARGGRRRFEVWDSNLPIKAPTSSCTNVAAPKAWRLIAGSQPVLLLLPTSHCESRKDSMVFQISSNRPTHVQAETACSGRLLQRCTNCIRS